MEEANIIKIYKNETDSLDHDDQNVMIPSTSQESRASLVLTLKLEDSSDVCDTAGQSCEVKYDSHQMKLETMVDESTACQDDTVEDPDSPKYVCGYCGLMYCLQEDYLHHLNKQHGCDITQVKLELGDSTASNLPLNMEENKINWMIERYKYLLQNPLLDGGDLSTMICMAPGETSVDDQGRPTYRNKRQINSSDRALLNAFHEISQMSDRLNLPRMIVDRADTLFKQVHEGKTIKGRSNDAIASACLYIACRQEMVPRTFKEIYAVSKVSKKEIGRVFKLILKTLETSVDLITTEDFMSRFCSNLSLPLSVQKGASHIARKATIEELVSGRSPISVAAAAIYMASQASEFKKTQKEIGDIAGVVEATIKQSYKLMYPKAHELFPDDFKFHTSIEQLPVQ